MKCRKYNGCAMPSDSCIDAGFFGYRHCINPDLVRARNDDTEDFYGEKDTTDRNPEDGNFVLRGLAKVCEVISLVSGSMFN